MTRAKRKIKSWRVYVGKGLSSVAAYVQFRKRIKGKRFPDWRAWKYSKKTGYVRAI